MKIVFNTFFYLRFYAIYVLKYVNIKWIYSFSSVLISHRFQILKYNNNIPEYGGTPLLYLFKRPIY